MVIVEKEDLNHECLKSQLEILESTKWVTKFLITHVQVIRSIGINLGHVCVKVTFSETKMTQGSSSILSLYTDQKIFKEEKRKEN